MYYFLRYLLTRIKCMVVVHSNDDNDVLPFRAGAARIKCLLTLIGFDIKCKFRLGVCSISAFCVFLVGPMNTIYGPSRTKKRHIHAFFKSHGTNHTFINYFATIFSAISFQFLANKQYPNST